MRIAPRRSTSKTTSRVVFRHNGSPRGRVGGVKILFAGAAGLAMTAWLQGCLAYKVVSMPVKLAATTVVVAGETAGAVVTTTGKLAGSGVNAIGNIGSGGIDSAAKLAQAGMVTFVDASSGAVVRVPWRDGMTLAAAGGAARIRWPRATWCD
jgi:hypothetical protein